MTPNPNPRPDAEIGDFMGYGDVDGYDKTCPHCGNGYYHFDEGERDVEFAPLQWVKHYVCPVCGEVVEARAFDQREAYLSAWRDCPGEMEHTIDRYEQLRQYEGV